MRSCSRSGLLRYKIAPKYPLLGPLDHSGVGRDPGVAGPVRSYNLVFTYPCQGHRRECQLASDEALHQLDGPVGFWSGCIAEDVGHPLEQFQLYVASGGPVRGLELLGNKQGDIGVIGALNDYGRGNSTAFPRSSISWGGSFVEVGVVAKVGLRCADEPFFTDFAGPHVAGVWVQDGPATEHVSQ